MSSSGLLSSSEPAACSDVAASARPNGMPTQVSCATAVVPPRKCSCACCWWPDSAEPIAFGGFLRSRTGSIVKLFMTFQPYVAERFLGHSGGPRKFQEAAGTAGKLPERPVRILWSENSSATAQSIFWCRGLPPLLTIAVAKVFPATGQRFCASALQPDGRRRRRQIGGVRSSSAPKAKQKRTRDRKFLPAQERLSGKGVQTAVGTDQQGQEDCGASTQQRAHMLDAAESLLRQTNQMLRCRRGCERGTLRGGGFAPGLEG